MPRQITRRQLLRLSAGSLLAAGLWPGALQAAQTDAEPFRFFVVNDLHAIDAKCGPFLRMVVGKMKQTQDKVDMCLIAGDLSENGTAEQLSMVRDIFKELAMPIKVVCGNHDFRTNQDRRPFEELCPDSINYTFEHRGWQFVALDSCQGLSANATIQKHTLDYVDQTLPKLDKNRPMVLFTHFPLGPKVRNRVVNADALLNRFKDHNLIAVYGGHYHAFTQTQLKATTLVTNRCCSFARFNHDGTKEKGYFLCQAKEGKIAREFVQVA